MVWGNRGMEGERKRRGGASVIHALHHTLSLNAISPECQRKMQGGADKEAVCTGVCIGVCVLVPVPVLDPRT